MNNSGVFRKHDHIQNEILEVCQTLKIEARKEYLGKGWRADVFVPHDAKPIAFEIQISPQTLKRTLDRQAKYAQDGITGCWLFENPIPKLIEERPDLPVFYVERDDNQKLLVNLGNRRKIDLHEFILNFISDKIQFRSIAKTMVKQNVNLVFYTMDCWKCQHKNYLYFVDKPFLSACNAQIRPEEALWGSSNMEYMPEIISVAKSFLENKNLRLGDIKPRHSNTVGKEYVSFGCYNCDSIFGDFFVFEAKIDIMYDPNRFIYSQEIDLDRELTLHNLPHWCYPKDGNFCDHD